MLLCMVYSYVVSATSFYADFILRTSLLDFRKLSQLWAVDAKAEVPFYKSDENYFY